ncbi:MAG: hypothetical protein H7A32_02225 [Deltaproteobacteria bacterium]|nr:hypothetical protein [Deltaproteobacteria bacterium]
MKVQTINMPQHEVVGNSNQKLSDLKKDGQPKPKKLADKSDKEIIDALVGGTSRGKKAKVNADVKAVLKPKSQWTAKSSGDKAPTLAEIKQQGLYGLKRPQAYDNAGDQTKQSVSQIKSAIKEAFSKKTKAPTLAEISKQGLYGLERPQADDTAQRVANIESALAEAFAKVDTSKLI